MADICVHTLRHSAAVARLESGVHIKAVADLLGQWSVAMTGDIDGHTSEARRGRRSTAWQTSSAFSTFEVPVAIRVAIQGLDLRNQGGPGYAPKSPLICANIGRADNVSGSGHSAGVQDIRIACRKTSE